MTRSVAVACVLLMFAFPASAGEIVRRALRVEEGATSLLKSDAWRPYGQGFARDGDAFTCDNGAAADAVRGAVQVVELNQREPRPIAARAEARADGVTGGRDPDFSLYLDLAYADGTHLWGQCASFAVGTGDWERQEVRVVPEKPVRRASCYLLFRRHGGRASFRNPQLFEVAAPAGAAVFDGVPVVLSPPRTGFLVRDVAAGSDFVSLDDGAALGLKLKVERETRGPVTHHRCRLEDATGADRAVTLIYTAAAPGDGWAWLGSMRQAPEPASRTRVYAPLANGRWSAFPIAAVARERVGRGVALDIGRPACFRVGYCGATGELLIAFDLGLAKEKPSAEFAFITFDFDAAWGLRSAVKAYHDAFPAYFRCLVEKQGIWMPFAKVSEVKGWQDFGFRFKEGDNETRWDDEHDLLTFRYTEPMTWWMRMPKDMPRTLDAAEAEARRLAASGYAAARAWLTSAIHDERGRPAARLLDTPWCDGAVWSMNSAPGIAGDASDFALKWGERVRRRHHAPGAPSGALDGEYVDSAEGYATDPLDFRREHFAAMRTPLTFSPGTHRPAVYRGLIAFEYVQAMAADVHGMGKLMMANGTPHRLPWLVAHLDVLGTETDWNRGGRWSPTSDADLLYRRALVGAKPYCFLMNTEFEAWPKELTERFMKRSLAYGMFPGFFSHNASEKAYFTRPELYERDRELFVRYVPLTRRVAEAGWEPVTLARSSDAKVLVERFGRKYLTVFNDSAERRTTRLRLEGLEPAGAKDLVSGREIIWKSGEAELTLDAEDVAVLEVK